MGKLMGLRQCHVTTNSEFASSCGFDSAARSGRGDPHALFLDDGQRSGVPYALPVRALEYAYASVPCMAGPGVASIRVRANVLSESLYFSG